MRNKWCLALIMYCALVPLVASQDVRSLNKIPGSVESTAQRLTHQLKKQGYEVARGYLKLYTKEDCDYSYPVFKTCFSNNPAAPYILPVLPTWRDEWLDPSLYGVFGPTQEAYNTTFRLDPREAILILGQLPPPGRYFGIQTYVFTRQGDFEEGSDQYKFISTAYPGMLDMFFTHDPVDSTRIELLATLGNSTNNVVIENRSAAAFNEQRYFVITPDQYMEEAVRGVLTDLGVEGNEVFSEPISSLLEVGLGRAADDFFTVIRYAMPTDENAAEKWRRNLPLVLLRVRDHREGRQPIPYNPVTLDPQSRQTPPESALAPELANLVAAVCRKWGVACSSSAPGQNVWRLVPVQLPPFRTVGPTCIEIGMNCLADNQDAAYSFSAKLPFTSQRVYAAVGALSTETGSATYVGLGINASKRQQGVDNVSDEDLFGSAADYGPAVTDHRNFFVYYLARDCSALPTFASQHCRPITESQIADYDPADPDSDRLMLSLRDYIFPGSERGPDPAYVLPPYVIAVK